MSILRELGALLEFVAVKIIRDFYFIVWFKLEHETELRCVFRDSGKVRAQKHYLGFAWPLDSL